MKALIAIMMIFTASTAHAECKRDYPKPVELNEDDLTLEEKQLLAELREIEADPELLKQAQQVAEEALSFTEQKAPRSTCQCWTFSLRKEMDWMRLLRARLQPDWSNNWPNNKWRKPNEGFNIAIPPRKKG
ncbi:MAG: hypothetical protein GKR97_16830 [Rhizobiaceae bacterium]|nr:hypothetical protein [Rhizobiaceae bacterium]